MNVKNCNLPNNDSYICQLAVLKIPKVLTVRQRVLNETSVYQLLRGSDSDRLGLNTMCYNEVVQRNCKKHGLTKHFPRQDGSFRCNKCASEWVTNSRRKKKEKLVNLFGGQCKLCGYSKYAGALDFHHKNAAEKEFALSVRGLAYSWDSVLKEAKKCVLLCKNCHAEVESGVTSL